ncbi:hypothetical protein BN982_02566 [Halobacillus karajensis]|uniref:Uncharacterized protein n=1 Tax=Halobacillus karajensis TaxID=195088 RepID=A0A024P7I3_9BACI|nr:hypothetical protein BN982_02566 [Halobacillus karajensis]CDQ25094.1 hypothetical protein BN983_03399 [Halobacillus karajensis]CDQ28545.1 hypothetical protein BN981_02853 [Halobacillus karajensis]
MNVLKMVNYILAAIGFGLGFSHLFINDVQIPSNIFILFLFIFFFLMGIEQVKTSCEIHLFYFHNNKFSCFMESSGGNLGSVCSIKL